MSLSKVCECILIVTGEVSSDGKRYDEWTEAFIRELGVLNRCLANVADEVIEVVYGIPITIHS
jgi:adenosylcobinamide kinase/adenosylcobinamide-phosphate guanylyltransferase